MVEKLPLSGSFWHISKLASLTMLALRSLWLSKSAQKYPPLRPQKFKERALSWCSPCFGFFRADSASSLRLFCANARLEGEGIIVPMLSRRLCKKQNLPAISSHSAGVAYPKFVEKSVYFRPKFVEKSVWFYFKFVEKSVCFRPKFVEKSVWFCFKFVGKSVYLHRFR